MEGIDFTLVDWSRAQFALTAMYHWIFVPLTLGITFIIAIMESIYIKTGDSEWKKITKFWMNVFAINFAIGVATGIILEFEFGTNWSNYSWFVGDIFGAPLAIEGIMAFFLESTFIGVMFFGWKRLVKNSICWLHGWLQSVPTYLPYGFWWQMDGCNFQLAWNSILIPREMRWLISGKFCFHLSPFINSYIP